MYVIVLFSSLNMKASGIDTIPFSKIDSLTYSLYLKGDWKNLKSVGNKLLASKVDWYYLRLRLAEANIQLNFPSCALMHLSMAERFSGRTDISNSMFARSYLQFGRYNQALFTAMHDKSSELSKKLMSKRILKESEIEGVFKSSTNTDLGVFTGLRLGATSYFGRRFSVYLSGQYYAQTNSRRDSLNIKNNVKVVQQQYYSKLNVLCTKEINLFVGGQFSSTSVKDDIQKNYLAFVGFEVIKPFMKYKFSAASTDFNGTDKIVSSISAAAFPFGNNSFYPWLSFSSVYDTDSSEYNTILDFGLGGKLAKNIWADIFVTPTAYDFHSTNDYEVTFNLQDRVNFKMGGGIAYYGFKNIGLKANYIMEYMKIVGIPEIRNYTQNTITLCLTWYR